MSSRKKNAALHPIKIIIRVDLEGAIVAGATRSLVFRYCSTYKGGGGRCRCGFTNTVLAVTSGSRLSPNKS